MMDCSDYHNVKGMKNRMVSDPKTVLSVQLLYLLEGWRQAWTANFVSNPPPLQWKGTDLSRKFPFSTVATPCDLQKTQELQFTLCRSVCDKQER